MRRGRGARAQTLFVRADILQLGVQGSRTRRFRLELPLPISLAERIKLDAY